MKQSDIEKDYWRYYVQIPYKSPVSKTYVDENGKNIQNINVHSLSS